MSGTSAIRRLDWEAFADAATAVGLTTVSAQANAIGITRQQLYKLLKGEHSPSQQTQGLISSRLNAKLDVVCPVVESATPKGNRTESPDPKRSRAGRIAALTRWAKEPDPSAALAPAREAAAARFEREVDPDNQLSPAERARRADRLRRAHMTRLAQRSAEKRRAARNRSDAA